MMYFKKKFLLPILVFFFMQCGSNVNIESENFLSFVDDYVDAYYKFYPVSGIESGFHNYTEYGLNDVSSEAIQKEIESINNFKSRLSRINSKLLTPELLADCEIVKNHIESRLYSLLELKIYKKDPSYYVWIIQNAILYQMIFDYAGSTLDSRLLTTLKYLDGTSVFIDNAISNLELLSKELIDYGIYCFEDLKWFLSNDVKDFFAGTRLADGSSADTVLSQKIDAANAAFDKMLEHLDFLKNDTAALKPSFAIGEKNLALKLKYEQGINLPDTNPFEKIIERTLIEINKDKTAFLEIAQSLNESKTPLENWTEVQTHHPVPGEVAAVLTNQVEVLKDFLKTKDVINVPEDETVVVKAAPAFMLYWYASMWQTGPFEPRPAPPAIYYASDPFGIVKGENGQTDEEAQNEFLTAMITPELWTTAAHEAYPGHFIQGYYTKRVKRDYVDKCILSKVPVTFLFAPFSYYEGWAHYCEQMIREQGFMEDADSTAYKEYLLGQLTDSLLRLCRTYAGIKMHLEEMTLTQAADFFEDNAFLTRENAEVEAERGTYEPDYILYSIGKLAVLQLRDDYKNYLQNSGKIFSLKEFHESFLMKGQYPISVIRKKMIPGDEREIIR